MDTAVLGAAGTAQRVGQGRFAVPDAGAAQAPIVVFPDCERPTRVVTLRITPQQHASIVAAAHLQQTSMNKLLVAAAMQAVEEAERQDAERIQEAAQQTTGASVGAA